MYLPDTCTGSCFELRLLLASLLPLTRCTYQLLLLLLLLQSDDSSDEDSSEEEEKPATNGAAKVRRPS
jgi:hypothetical protein